MGAADNKDVYRQALAYLLTLDTVCCKHIEQLYDFEDCSLGVLLMNALTAADGVVIPVQTQKFALNGLQGLMDVIEQIKGTVNPALEIIGIGTCGSRAFLHTQKRA